MSQLGNFSEQLIKSGQDGLSGLRGQIKLSKSLVEREKRYNIQFVLSRKLPIKTIDLTIHRIVYTQPSV